MISFDVFAVPAANAADDRAAARLSVSKIVLYELAWVAGQPHVQSLFVFTTFLGAHEKFAALLVKFPAAISSRSCFIDLIISAMIKESVGFSAFLSHDLDGNLPNARRDQEKTIPAKLWLQGIL